MSIPKYILGLDLGTTGNRAIVFDRKQNIVASAYEEFPQYYPKPGWVEHDADEIFESALCVLGKVVKKVGVENIASIGITNQRETVVLWNKKTSKPVGKAIVWQDRRTSDFCNEFKKKDISSSIHHKTGLVLDPYFSATKIRWMLKHNKKLESMASQGEVLAGTIDTWILWKLSLGQCFVTDTSNASRTLLFNIHKLCWDDELCRIFGIPKNILAEIKPSSALDIAFIDAKFFGKQVKVTGIAGDQQAAAFAQGCFKPGVVKNTYGTGLFALKNTGNKPRFSKNLLTTVAWSIGAIQNTQYAVEGSVFIGGAAVQWLRDGLGLIRDSSETFSMAKSVTDNGGIYFVPALSGLGAPYWDPYARGVIVGITRGTTKAHLVRAALESIAYQSKDILDVMQKDIKHSIKALSVDGGACKNNFLMQFQADLLGARVIRPVVTESTALGAAALAGIAVGFWKNQQEFIKTKKIDKIFYPNPNQNKNLALCYKLWKEAVKRSMRWMRQT